MVPHSLRVTANPWFCFYRTAPGFFAFCFSDLRFVLACSFRLTALFIPEGLTGRKGFLVEFQNPEIDDRPLNYRLAHPALGAVPFALRIVGIHPVMRAQDPIQFIGFHFVSFAGISLPV
jgi:hypothetical protein